MVACEAAAGGRYGLAAPVPRARYGRPVCCGACGYGLRFLTSLLDNENIDELETSAHHITRPGRVQVTKGGGEDRQALTAFLPVCYEAGAACLPLH
jgi:hypothetical protein